MRDAAERARRASSAAVARAAVVGACAASALFWLSGATVTRRALGWIVDDGGIAPDALVDARARAYAFGTAVASSSGWTLADVARALEDVGEGETTRAWGAETPRFGDDARGVDRTSIARFVGTHHKTGTALMRDVLDTVTRGWAYAFFDAREVEDREATNASLDDVARRSFLDADVVFDYHFGKAAPRYLVSDELERSLESLVSLRADAREYRIVHVVRNPVDVIVSGLTYHRRTPLDEKWLTSVREELRGRTYADVLANATPGEAVAAEMLFSDDELRMLVLTYIQCDRDDWCLNIRLEELETNFDFWIGRALKFLKLPSKDIEAMVRAAAAHDVGRWSEDELQKNEHFTKREDRAPYYDAIRHDAEILSTLGRLQIAMNYTSSTGNDALTV